MCTKKAKTSQKTISHLVGKVDAVVSVGICQQFRTERRCDVLRAAGRLVDHLCKKTKEWEYLVSIKMQTFFHEKDAQETQRNDSMATHFSHRAILFLGKLYEGILTGNGCAVWCVKGLVDLVKEIKRRRVAALDGEDKRQRLWARERKRREI